MIGYDTSEVLDRGKKLNGSCASTKRDIMRAENVLR